MTQEKMLQILKSMTPEQRALVNKMVQDELEFQILYGSSERKQETMRNQVRAHLNGEIYSPHLKGILN